MTVRRALVLAGLGVAVWSAWCAWIVVRAHDDIQAGRELVRQVQHVGPAGLLEGEGRAELDAAGARFAAADDRLGHPVLAPLRIVPVLGRQLRSASAMAHSTDEVVAAGRAALAELDPVLSGPLPAGAGRTAVLRQVAEVAAGLEATIGGVDLGPTGGLIGRLADAREELGGDLDDMRATLERTRLVAGSLADALDGPGRWLLLAANNAQMQNGSGMFLQWGTLEVTAGEITVGQLEPAQEVVPAQPVELDADQAALWPWMDPNGDVRHLGTSVRFDATARTAAALYEASGRGPVDGVLAVDPFALQFLLTLSGDVQVDGVPVSPDGIVADLLHDQYLALADGVSNEAQAERRDRLGAVARAALEALGRSDRIDRSVIDSFGWVVRTRHLMAWSADEEVQAGFEAGGVAGAVPEDGLVLSLVNRGGNKLDWFVGLDARLEIAADGDEDVVEVRVEVRNPTAVEGEPTYVVGPYNNSGLAPGEYQGVLTLTVPGAATGVEVVGRDPLVEGPDGDHLVVGTAVRVPAGATEAVTFRFRLPADEADLDVVASARPVPTRWSAGDWSWEDTDSRRITLP
ncbi:MAG: DUF4012 domain-containing protein [Acidimicrobiia bacterium]